MYSGNSKITLIYLVAGVGKRMGLNYPKQFLEINGKPLFIYALEKAESFPEIDDIILVTGKDSIDIVKNIVEKYSIKKVKKIVIGGSERQYSVENGLNECSNPNNYIAIHDGVRPFLKREYFVNSIDILSKDVNLSGVVIGVPLKDTIKRIDSENNVVETPKREEYVAVQTPQIFRYDDIKEGYIQARKEEFLGTDDSSLVERLGKKIKILIGDYGNIKVTTKEDLNYLDM